MRPKRLLAALVPASSLTSITAIVFGSAAVVLAVNALFWQPARNPRWVIAALAVTCVLIALYVLARGKRFTVTEAFVLAAVKLFAAGSLTWTTESTAGAVANGAGLSITGVYVMWFLHPLAGRAVLFLGTLWWFAAILHHDDRDLIPVAVSLVVQAIVSTEVLSRIKRQMDRSARTDPLTGVLNWLGVREFLDRELVKSARARKPLCVVAVDLDGLRTINNTLGHAAGDQLLVSTSRHWREGVRRRHAIGRIGGDEFLFVLPSTSADAADEMMRGLAATSPGAWSAGVAVATGEDTVESIVERADQLMYVQKASRDRPDVADDGIGPVCSLEQIGLG